ncbi:MAG: pyridoxal phosphate-dependent aminotransferase [Candidatus Micrarchaeaceae archaeon]
MLLSKRSAYASNPIEEEDHLASQLEKRGKKIYRLNRGDPAKYFPTPKYIIKAYKEALDNGLTSYTAADGARQLKGAIASRYSRLYGLKLSNEDIIVTAGVSEALMFLNNALIDESDMAVIFKPYYPLYHSFLKLSGGIPILERYDEDNGWNIHVDSLEKTLGSARKDGKLKRIKYILITNPNNPTGTVLKRSVLKDVVDIANEYNVLLISDEIYDEIIFNKARFTSISEIAKGMPYAILNGASKVYDSTGFRIGFILVPEDDKDSKLLKDKLRDYAVIRLSVNSPAQFAISVAISNIREHKRSISSMVKAIGERANHATKLLNENPLISTVAPGGAFYMLPKIDLNALHMKNDSEFAEMLLKEEGIQITRGSGFGAQSHFRIVALPPKEILDYSINRINAFCSKHRR